MAQYPTASKTDITFVPKSEVKHCKVGSKSKNFIVSIG